MKYIPYALLLGAAALFPYCVQRVFLHTPIEAEMGTAKRSSTFTCRWRGSACCSR